MSFNLAVCTQPKCRYNYVRVSGPELTEIKANTFMDIVFSTIEISYTNLVHIHPDAFMDTYNTTDTLYIRNNPQLEPDTIYNVMSKFTNATFIEEYHNAKFTMMPANAFSNSKQSKLKRLHIWSSETTIGSHAISSLYSLRYIMFGGPVNHIMANAFAIDRPMFHPFYMENELNTIDFKGNKGFDCQDCRFNLAVCTQPKCPDNYVRVSGPERNTTLWLYGLSI
ncbi:unnamed protein product [Medioppia subpectinata]|uniref:Receptor L-domain domain-containing protein n=1 Tax=Medioppia subpectinata TaxID=1979941 RepID=A0A7R9KER8_9ACAR|nr:unnamed protein product [Medioppia subpectinata]CAG2100990.1 unnamed protein product [Medioppia subpectinata]